ncbi:sulfatase [Zobellia galactanivorans]|uniref:Iduronate-2-sulfatase, family S1-7 n=1 Tax=Zobellia galactanivorans (strain DSM 12802 / CCUG 47099 / CIP 106680 / NCIMB 13871 / Dsij) TaxID=63186 RepID=G0L7B4_ZOBGA|nr:MULTISPECIES: sulfatase [Zobellia]MDO6810726.1 sulfatase [Zobellia galactanivorans]OWW23590.1 iduronate-2-sulfatase [Zobellia sp. OII3]CAZ97285.1 Iduronate-2-sulfatase, family S1-7 [Zobellia galactanivorans]
MSLSKFIGILFLLGQAVGCSSAQNSIPKKESKKPNILFIAIDDLRPELGSYGSEIARSPNLDKLASEGLQFNRAYCQQAICGPSRASVLTGLRPETSGIFHNYLKIRELHPDIVTLPQHFKNNGYESVYYGKIFHHGDLDDSLSWSRVPGPQPKSVVGFALPENQQLREETRKEMFSKYGDVAKYGLAMGPAYESAKVPDNTYADGYNTDLAIADIKKMAKKSDQPFFLGLGFHKPHLNWVAPKKYWDLYDESKIPMASDSTPPKDGAAMGLHPSFELRVRSGIPKTGKLPPELARTLKHAYLACISYVDAQIGRAIQALEEAGIRDNTIIIVWSDHGWHLGDMGIWGKATNYEIATRVPLMIWTPDMPDSNRGVQTEALVELIDMYPTLCELAGIEKPVHLEGQSFAPLLKHPEQDWKTAVFSQFPSPALREWGSYPLRPAMRETYFGPLLEEVELKIKAQQKEKWDRNLFENKIMGYAMRTDQYRFIVWKDRTLTQASPLYFELYDHKKDPGETVNIASSNPQLVARLMAQFKKEKEQHSLN